LAWSDLDQSAFTLAVVTVALVHDHPLRPRPAPRPRRNVRGSLGAALAHLLSIAGACTGAFLTSNANGAGTEDMSAVALEPAAHLLSLSGLSGSEGTWVAVGAKRLWSVELSAEVRADPGSVVEVVGTGFATS